MNEWRVGTDVVDLARFSLAAERCGLPFVRRVVGREEMAHGALMGVDSTTTAALCFGIKEGLIKALGGLPQGASLRDIRVFVGPRTEILLDGPLAEWSEAHRLTVLASSVCHTDGVALASVLLSRSFPHRSIPATLAKYRQAA